MFTGIIEALGKVEKIEENGGNVDYTFSSPFTSELKIDQSVAHNGCCLTVVEISGDTYKVTAIEESLKKTNLGKLQVGDEVNLERLDGHIVQGHVDTTGRCTEVIQMDGSTEFFFEYTHDDITVPKGSITVNGASLTVVVSEPGHFSVHIIPFTIEHTNFKNIQVGTEVNLEFDIIGKYVRRLVGPAQS